MFPISPAFQRILDSTTGRNRVITWWGTLTLTNNTVYNFNTDHISAGTGQLVSQCNLPGIGGAFATRFQARFLLPISPLLMKNAKIALYVRLIDSTQVSTWASATDYFWSDMLHSGTKWGDFPCTLQIDIPMGQFTIKDAKSA